MKTQTTLILTLSLLLVSSAVTRADTNAAPAPADVSTPDVLTVAVFDFESKDEDQKNLGGQIATLVGANLSAEPDLDLVERAELEKALGEQELGLSGTVSPDTAAKVGQLTGAKVLVTGRVFESGNELFIVTKVIGTETSRVFGQVTSAPASGAAIGDMAKDAARQIAAAIAAHGSQLVAKVETRDDLVAKIKQAVAGKTLPAVSVQISEQHYGNPVIDPAAETEISMILKESGFTVVDEKSTQKADVNINGTAFSAYALRKGNLVSCKARIELTVHKAGTGEVIAVDRQTSVAVDIAEQTAAKNALQLAADELAERVIPQLAK